MEDVISDYHYQCNCLQRRTCLGEQTCLHVNMHTIPSKVRMKR